MPSTKDPAPGNSEKAAGQRQQSLIHAITRGILADQQLRRKTMGGIILVASSMLMLGATLAANWLYQRPLLFIIYWLAVAWLTLTAILMALFDILLVRKAGIAARHKLKRDVFGSDDQDE